MGLQVANRAPQELHGQHVHFSFDSHGVIFEASGWAWLDENGDLAIWDVDPRAQLERCSLGGSCGARGCDSLEMMWAAGTQCMCIDPVVRVGVSEVWASEEMGDGRACSFALVRQGYWDLRCESEVVASLGVFGA